MIVVFEEIWPNIRIVTLLHWVDASVSYDQTQS